MRLKDWLAGKVAGPQSHGDVIGRHARKLGSALANIVFLIKDGKQMGAQFTSFQAHRRGSCTILEESALLRREGGDNHNLARPGRVVAFD
jgi:hypothetical protein